MVRTASGNIAVFRTEDDEVFALDDRCPHKGGPLSQGIVHNKRVTCPLHNFVIELASGEAVAPDQGCTHSHPTKVENGTVWLSRSSARGRCRRLRVTTRGSQDDLSLLRRRLRRAWPAGIPRAPSPSSGDPLHPANFGRLCGKGSALAETIGLEGRLLEPMVDGRAATWDAALGHVADGFSKAIREHGPDSVAFYVSGQLLTEDYYVVNKLAKGFVGTANIDTNSRLCMASSVVGHKRAFGSDTVPGCYEDLDQADLLVLVGSNAAWCHPILHQRMLAAKAKNPACRIVVIDPRRTATCEGADLHLPVRSGSDSVLFNGLLAYLAKTKTIDGGFVGDFTTGAEAALAQVAGQTIAHTATVCGLPGGAVEQFFGWFAKTERVVTLYSQGINQSSSGVDKVNAIINCHLLTGRIGKPGMGPFSLTGQPNAMGGREVGGLANQLAAHMEIENPQHRDTRSAVLALACDRRQVRAQGGRDVRRDGRRTHQGGLDHVDQSAGQPAGCESRPRRT